VRARRNRGRGGRIAGANPIAGAFAALLALLLAAGCWVGPDFYAAADLRPALAPGDYRIEGELREGRPFDFRAETASDGSTRILPLSETGEPARAGFAAIDGSGRHFAAWFIEPDRSGVGLRNYALLGRMRDGSYRVLGPGCERDRAAAAGAEVIANGAVCRFASRAELEAGLRRVIPQLAAGIRIVPLGRR
jgi:hypothetical protein